jgi:hypothetical protein
MESLQALEQPVPDLDAILRRLEAAQYEAAQSDSASYVAMLEGPAKVAEIAAGKMEAITAMNGRIREHCRRSAKVGILKRQETRWKGWERELERMVQPSFQVLARSWSWSWSWKKGELALLSNGRRGEGAAQ